MKNKKIQTRILALAVSTVMAASQVPYGAYAEETGTVGNETVSEDPERTEDSSSLIVEDAGSDTESDAGSDAASVFDSDAPLIEDTAEESAGNLAADDTPDDSDIIDDGGEEVSFTLTCYVNGQEIQPTDTYDEEGEVVERYYGTTRISLNASASFGVKADQYGSEEGFTYEWRWMTDDGCSDPVGTDPNVQITGEDVAAYLSDAHILECAVTSPDGEKDYADFSVYLDTGLTAAGTPGTYQESDQTYHIDPADFSRKLEVQASIDPAVPDQDLTYSWETADEIRYDSDGPVLDLYEEEGAGDPDESYDGSDTGSDSADGSDSDEGDDSGYEEFEYIRWQCTVSDAYGNQEIVRFVLDDTGYEDKGELPLTDEEYMIYLSSGETIDLAPWADEDAGEPDRECNYDWSTEYDQEDSEDDSYDGSGYEEPQEVMHYLMDSRIPDEEVSCTVTDHFGHSARITYHIVNLSAVEDAEDLSFDDWAEIPIYEKNGGMVHFQAPEDGTYVFYSLGYDPVKARFYEVDGDGDLQYADDYGYEFASQDWECPNFSVTKDLAGGSDYYLSVYSDADPDAGLTWDGVFVSVHEGEDHPHTYVEDTSRRKNPTCVSKGEEWDYCQVCWDWQKKELQPTGRHTWTAFTTVRPANALRQGLQSSRCSVCGTVRYRNLPKLTPTVTLNAYSVPLKVKQRSQVITASGFAAGDYVKSWTSSNSKVVNATPAGNSVILKAGKKPGKAVITVTLASGKTAQLTVKVQKKKVTTKRINIKTARKLTLARGSKVSIGASVTPITSPEKLKYRSSKKKVASVSKQGVITAKKKGKAVITVQSGKKKIKIQVTVK